MHMCILICMYTMQPSALKGSIVLFCRCFLWYYYFTRYSHFTFILPHNYYIRQFNRKHCLYSINTYSTYTGLPWQLSGKESTCQCSRCWLNLWVRKVPWRKKWQPTPVFLYEKSHGWKCLVGYSAQGCKRVRYNLTTKQLATKQTTDIIQQFICRYVKYIQ